MKQYVLGLAFSRKGDKIVFVEKQKPEWQKGMYNGVGGKIEAEDASPIDAMVREFQEETGTITEQTMWKHFSTMEGTGFVVFCFVMFSNVIYQCETMEEEKIEMFDVDKIPLDKVINNIPALIELARLKEFDSQINFTRIQYN